MLEALAQTRFVRCWDSFGVIAIGEEPDSKGRRYASRRLTASLTRRYFLDSEGLQRVCVKACGYAKAMVDLIERECSRDQGPRAHHHAVEYPNLGAAVIAPPVTVPVVRMPPIPIPMPIAIVAPKDVIASAQNPLIRRPCDRKTRSLRCTIAGRRKMILLTIRRSYCADGRNYRSAGCIRMERLSAKLRVSS